MNREQALEYGKSLGVKPSTYGEQCVMVDTVLAMQPRLCDNCRFDYCGCSIQDNILQIEPEASFETFGCTEFKPKCK